MSIDFTEPSVVAEALAKIAREGESAGDLHLQASWFRLQAETAILPSARLSLVVCGDRSWLPLMISDEYPGRLLGLSNYYAPLFGMINESRADPQLLRRAAEQLRQSTAGFHEARFSPMDPDSVSWRVLAEAFSDAGWLTDGYFCFGNWYHPVKGETFSSYLSGRPSAVRNTLTRARRRLEKTPGYALCLIEGDELCQADIDAFVSVYNRSWKTPEPFSEFIPGLCRMASSAGWLRLGIIRLEGIPIAAQLWLVQGGKANIVKLAYDQAYAKTSAGTVLTAALMERVIDRDKVEEIDYLIGDDAYKRDWMSCRREKRGLIAFNPRFIRGGLAAAWHYGGKLKRRLLG